MPFPPTKIEYTCQNYTLNPAQEQEESASLNVPETVVQRAISSVKNTVATLCKREGRWGKRPLLQWTTTSSSLLKAFSLLLLEQSYLLRGSYRGFSGTAHERKKKEDHESRI